jgi:hypothetical protein
MRCEGLQGRPTAPRGASLLEMGTYRNGDSVEPFRRRRITAKRPRRPSGAGEWSICHRDIVNLITRRRLARRHSSGAPWRRGHDSIDPHCRPSGRSIPGLRSDSPPADARRGIESGKRSDGRTTRLGLFAQPAGHRMMVPANASPRQKASQRAKSVRIRNAR